MIEASKHDATTVVNNFQLEGSFIGIIPYGSGHINDTYASCFQAGNRHLRYIHQRINHNIFKEPEKLMDNIVRVTSYAREQIIASGGNPERQTLNVVLSISGKPFYRTHEGDYWRTYKFIEGAKTYDQVEDPRHVYSASKAFGQFQKMLSTLPGERLHETIPDFHNTRKRYEAFVAALESDPLGRAASVRREIDFVLSRESDVSVIVDMLSRGEIPERVTHNDTKLNNVMIDDATGEGICVIDLDTVMPGSALYDFGDSVRIGASTAAEDERDLSKVGVSHDMFDRLVHGYLDAGREFLTPTEIDNMPLAAKLITFECGMRFLTDHLMGDVYFKVHRDGHNLDRCRTQFKMVEQMEKDSGELAGIVEKYRHSR
ncbi:MAG: phosphotransferase enzyme family protein [Armatimonadota bacterium]